MSDEYNFWAEQEAANNQPSEPIQDSVYRMSGNEIPNEYGYSTQTVKEVQVEGLSSGGTSEKSKKSFGKKVAGLIGSAVIFGLVAGVAFQGVNWITEGWNSNNKSAGTAIIEATAQPVSEKEDSLGATSVTDGVTTQTSDVSGVVESTMPSIVSITSTISQTYNMFGQDYSEDGQGSGSGIIVGKNDKELLVATNNHVVEGAKEISVTFIDSKVVKAEVKGTDSTADLAVVAIPLSDIKSETLDAIKIATLGNSDDVKVGQMAIAIGNALGYGQSVTVGYISAKDREVTVSDTTMVLLQTDAAINPGNSGGALININGEVIGINSVKYASSDVEGMGYAIPISRATPIITELMKREKLTNEEKGYLGITGIDITEEDNQRINIPVGVYVRDVSKDGAAKEAGILSGDIITKVNGNQVQTISSLQERINSYRIGTKVELTIMRNTDGEYKEQVITVTLKGSKTLDSLTEGTTDSQITEPQNPAQQDPTLPNDGSSDGNSDNSIEDFFNGLE